MNRILKRIAEEDESKRVEAAMRELGFGWCTTGGGCTAYYKGLDDNRVMYVIGEDGDTVPERFDETYSVAIMENEFEDNEHEFCASFDNFEDFKNNYMDMSKYEEFKY